jgi:hypothetical protein
MPSAPASASTVALAVEYVIFCLRSRGEIELPSDIRLYPFRKALLPPQGCCLRAEVDERRLGPLHHDKACLILQVQTVHIDWSASSRITITLPRPPPHHNDALTGGRSSASVPGAKSTFLAAPSFTTSPAKFQSHVRLKLAHMMGVTQY